MDKLVLKAGISAVLVIAILMVGLPQYGVYSARLDGEAKLAHAQSEREVQVKDAQGKLEASTMLAKVEVERAKGVSEANKIIGDSLKDNEGYLRYLYINNLEKAEAAGSSVYYIPTEAGLPILEAGKRK